MPLKIIRHAELRDLDELTTLLKALFSIENDFQFDEARQRVGLQTMLTNHKGCVLVAEYNNQVIGMCSGQILISTAEGGPALIVEDVVVADEYRGQGVGKRLLEGISAWAKTKDISRLQLLADQNNQKALSFYNSAGWQKTQLVCLRKYI